MIVLQAFLNYGPYHFARLTAAQSLAAGSGWEVVGLSMASHQADYTWQTDTGDIVITASPHLTLEQVPAKQWRTMLTPILDQVHPDVCAIAGYSHRAMLSLITLCGERDIPWILMSDSQEIDEVRRPCLEWTKSRLVRLASSGLVAGQPHLDYLAKLGLPATETSLGYDVVDNGYFARESAKWREHSLPQSSYFLASARFIPKKNLFRLLEAYSLASQPHTANGQSPWPLVLLGDGDLKSKLLAHAAKLGLKIIEHSPWELETLNLKPATRASQPTVYFPGFRQIDELPRFYAHAGAFVHASTSEQWGLVVNEAMACGLPVIVSNRCGCAPDLVQDGVNGWTFDPYSVEALAPLMDRVSSLPETARTTLGEASRHIIAHWGPERFAKGLHEAAKRALATGPKRGSWLDRLLLRMLILR